MIGVIYGGESLEHEVSVMSAEDVFTTLDVRKFYIDKAGTWFVDGIETKEVVSYLKACSVIFPLVHGTSGEDGTLQGFLEMNGIAYVGCGVAASSICMDKDVTKRILESHGVETTPYKTYYSLDEALNDEITTPCIVKVSSMGSTFGVYKVEDDPTSFLEQAFALSPKVLVEEFIDGREIWCSVLQDGQELIISPPCEIVSSGGFFTYEEKYTKESKTIYHVPAEGVNAEEIKEVAKKTFKVLGCSGFARVDMFITKENKILVNEVNTLPGFRKSSLYPKALKACGYCYETIISILLKEALRAKEKKDGYRTCLM